MCAQSFLRAPPKRIQQRRVVVTGLGLITPLGNEIGEFWNSLVAGKCAVTNLNDSHQPSFPNFPISKLPNTIFAPLSPLSAEDQKELTQHEFKELGKFAGMGYLAVKKALIHSHIRPPVDLSSTSSSPPSSSPSSSSDFPSDFTPLSSTRTGVIMGSGIGSLQDIANTDRLLLNDGYRRVSPYFIPKILINLSSGLISKKFGIKGPIGASVLACSTGADVIAQGFNYIRDGSADVMIVGSSEDSMNHLTICGFSRMRALATNENAKEASKPFDSKRNGFVIGEGAGAIILEDLDHALKRGAKIYAEIRGFGNAGEGYHWSRPSPDAFGAISAMKNAIENSNLLPEHVDYINAHATSTPAGDEIENYAIKEVFGEHAKKLAVSSTKGAMGHLLGASGVVEAIISILSIENGVIPPTLNLKNLDEEFNLNYVPNEAQTKEVNVAVSNSFGFGGVNVSLLFAKAPVDLDQ